MKYKLLCIDMDGTLLNSKKKVSEASRSAIRKAHELGVRVVVTTGRMYTDAEAYSKLIGVNSPVIASNGGVIREKKTDKPIYMGIIDEDTCRSLLKLFERHNINPALYTPDVVYSGSLLFKLFMQFAKLKGAVNREVELKYIHRSKAWDKILEKERNNIVKCEVLHRDEKKLHRIRGELARMDNIEIVSSSKYNIEITSKGVSKGSAVRRLAEHYGIKREEVMVIGDSENDLSMIEFAGLGIAMGNAIPAVKEKADYVTESNDDEGVAMAINRFILETN